MKIIAFLAILNFAFLTIYSQSTASIYDSGVELFQKKNYELAIQKFTSVLEKNKDYYEANYYLGRIYHETGKSEDALKEFANALKKNPDFYPALYHRALLNFEIKKYQQAINDLEKAIQIKNHFTDAFILRAKSHENLNNIDVALQDYSMAISLEKQKAEIYYRRGLLYSLSQKPNLAIHDFTSAIERDPGYEYAYFERGKAWESREKYENALKDYTESIKLNLYIEDVFIRRANMYLVLKEYENSLKDYTFIITKYKTRDYRMYFNRAICLKNLSRYEEAVQDLSKAAQMDSKNDTICVEKGNVLINQNKMILAQREFSRAILLNPNNSEAFLGRGISYFEIKRYDLSIEDLSQSIKLTNNAEAYFYRGKIKDLGKDRKGACDDLRAAANGGHKEAAIKMKEICK